MRRNLWLIITIVVVFSISVYAQNEYNAQRQLVLRMAKERAKTTVAVEVYLINNILEVTVIARMYAAKPKIYNVILVGPQLGRMSPGERKTLYPKAEDQEALFLTEDMDGRIIRLSKKTKEKKPAGTLTKELVKFKLPIDKISPNKRYQLWVKVESMQRGGRINSFKFDLKNLARLIQP